MFAQRFEAMQLDVRFLLRAVEVLDEPVYFGVYQMSQSCTVMSKPGTLYLSR